MTGKRTIYAANGTTVRTTSGYGNNFGYTNRRHDEESGLMYFRARYYNPLTGEFLGRDPMEFVDGMSLYRGYFIVNSIDPLGLEVGCQRFQRKLSPGLGAVPIEKIVFLGPLPAMFRMKPKVEIDFSYTSCPTCCMGKDSTRHKIQARLRGGLEITLTAGFDYKKENWMGTGLTVDGYIGIRGEAWFTLVGSADVEWRDPPCGKDVDWSICAYGEARFRLSGGAMFKARWRWWSTDFGVQVYGQITYRTGQCWDFRNLEYIGTRPMKGEWSDFGIFAEACLHNCYRFQLF